MMLYVFAGTDSKTGRRSAHMVRAMTSMGAAIAISRWASDLGYLAAYPDTREGLRAAERLAIEHS